MDGTITLSENLHFQAFSTVFREHGVYNYTLDEEVRKYAGSGSKKIFESVFAERGITISPQEIELCVEKKRELYTKIVQESEIPVVRGVKEFVQRQHKEGKKMIIATGNSNKEAVHFILKKVGLDEYFPEIVSVSEVREGKPAPDVFLVAAERIGCVADECVVFEDAINGLVAAERAGMRCIALATTLSEEELWKYTNGPVIKDYTEITDTMLNF